MDTINKNRHTIETTLNDICEIAFSVPSEISCACSSCEALPMTMVLQTSHTGVTAAVGQGQPQVEGQIATVGPPRYPNVYESKRVLQNWELMKIAHETGQVNVKYYHMCQELLNRDRVSNTFSVCEPSCKGRTEGIYQVLLGLKEWRGGLLYLGELATVMKKFGYEDLAESFPP